MKRLLIITMILLCLSGCRKKEEQFRVDNSNPYEWYFARLPDRPSEDDDIFINANDGFYNTDVWDAFLDAVDAGRNAEVTVARYTIEGEVIYELLKYEGEKFFLYVDNSRDSYGNHEPAEHERMWLYEYSFIRDEEINGTVRPYIYRYCFMSEQLLENYEDVQAVVDEWFMGKKSELVVVWADSSRYEG